MTQPKIRFVMRAGRRIETPCLRLYVAPTSPGGEPAVACIVGKRVHRHATVRHRYQRLMRVAARAVIAHLTSPRDMVWVAKPEILRIQKLQELEKSLTPYLNHLAPNSKRKTQKSK